MTTPHTSGAADRAIENCPELNMGNYDEVDVEQHLNDWAIRANVEIDRLHKLAAGQVTAAQAVVQDDIITIRKPTTRAEMLWLLKLAHLVISDVDKTLEETFAPAQELRESFTAADMATAASQGFRDGVASLSASAGEPFGWVKQSEIDTSKQFGGSINLWRRRYDCDVPVYLAAPITSAEGVGAVCGPQASGFAADSVTAPAGGETYHLGACIVDGVLSATVMRKERGCSGDVTVLLSEQIPVEHLQDRDVICHSTSAQPVAEPAKSTSHGQAPASVLHLVHSAFAEIAMAFPKAFALHKVGIADTAVREALAAPVPPPECETEAEKRAFAFGWFKALESERMKAESVQEDAARYRWLREGNDAKHGAAWHVAVNLYGCEWDAAIDAARKQGGA